VHNVTEWDSATQHWQPMGSGVNHAAQALTTDRDGNVYVGGDFSKAGDKLSSFIARWNVTGNDATTGNTDETPSGETGSGSGSASRWLLLLLSLSLLVSLYQRHHKCAAPRARASNCDAFPRERFYILC
jgi:hypothetical protein